MKLFKNYPYKKTLFLGITFFLLVVFSTFIFIFYRLSINNVVSLTADQQHTNLILMQQQIEEHLRTLENQSVVLSRQSSFQNIIGGGQSYYQVNLLTNDFSTVIYSNGPLHTIEVYTENAPTHNIQSPVRYGELSDVEDNQWYDRLNERNVAWIGIREVEMMHDEVPVISHGRAIRSSRGELEALLILNLDPLIVEHWLRSFESVSPLYFLNEQNQILASTDQYMTGDIPPLPENIKEQEASLSLQINDDLYVSTEVAPYGWRLVSVTPYSQLTEGIQQMVINMIGISIVIIFLAIITIHFLTREMTKPIQQLSILMDQYKLNRSLQKIPVDYKNEFGQLFLGYKNLITRNERLMHSIIQNHKQQKRMELKALQANINPHFLYNTLDQLNWRAITNEDDEMSEMIELLGDMLRVGLSNGESVISIEDEVNYVQKYLQLQIIRKNESFSYSIHLSDDAKNFYIPKLTLQPFIENSLVHGLQEKTDGKIELIIISKENSIEISIKDNGVGADNFEKTGRKKTGGYGIRNVKERLDNYFDYKANLVLKNLEEGVLVVLTIPKINNKQALNSIK